jgi:hypothetical protein
MRTGYPGKGDFGNCLCLQDVTPRFTDSVTLQAVAPGLIRLGVE